MAEKNILHIYLDQKVYVSIDKDREIISSLDGNDDQITQFLMNTHPELAADPQKLQEMIKIGSGMRYYKHSRTVYHR
ncbi:MAG: hypothetical protein MZV70_32300 [Desulfobacterales bacterium]|nr:hypothetical protein [Desulfobacterales bacterium]